jgi:lycopene cyclase domain-containing protein
MSSHYTYLLIDVGTILFPLLFSFDKRLAFYRQWRYLVPGMLLTAALFIAWDVYFTHISIWSFNPRYTLPYRLLSLPIEEWLFFLFIPYSCTFIYASLEVFDQPNELKGGWTSLLIIAAVLLIVAVLYRDRAYTFSALAGCAIALSAAYLIRHSNPAFSANRFLVAYAISLIPFLIVNGLLTSLPVVLYNDEENTGLRIFSIPAEDVFYGMFLILGNIWGLTYSRGRSSNVRTPGAQPDQSTNQPVN